MQNLTFREIDPIASSMSRCCCTLMIMSVRCTFLFLSLALCTLHNESYMHNNFANESASFMVASFFSSFQDASSHMNLGAMLHLVGKLTEAEDHYLTALRLEPGNQATATNIQRLHNIMRSKGLKTRDL